VPTYRLTSPDGSCELLEADYARDEGAFTTLYGTAIVIGRPREVVVRRAPRDVLVEEVLEEVAARPSWAP
jgi:hypothetical protein